MKAAVIQLNSGGDLFSNRTAAEQHVRAAAAAGAKLVVMPEKWPILSSDEETRAAAEQLEGPSMLLAANLAQELSIDLIAGSFAEVLPNSERLANTSVHFGPDGRRKAVYRKIHLFDADVGGRVYRESDAFRAGNRPVLTTLADGTVLGMAICFDLRFPDLFQNLAEHGAEVIVLPAAFTKTTTDAHWEVLIRARAIENGVHVVAANQDGRDGADRPAGGRSMIVGPWGDVLVECPPGRGFALTDLDPGARRDARKALPIAALRRDQANLVPMRGLEQ
jgi:predicted amidohydrolase